MPAQQCVGSDEERLSARSAQQPAGRSEEHPVGLLQSRTAELTAKNRQLVSEHHDLKLLELTRAQPQRRHRERTPKQQIHQRDQQEAPSTRSRTRSATLRPSAAAAYPQTTSDGFTHPTRSQRSRQRTDASQTVCLLRARGVSRAGSSKRFDTPRLAEPRITAGSSMLSRPDSGYWSTPEVRGQ
jgi:hypothetical protein